ncbi:MAG: hypothetical protein QM802_06040 [Agriterribacter sp.]
MKKLAAIVFLSLYLFNLGGYSFVFGYFIHQSEQHIAQQIDHHQYDEDELVALSIPVHLPYIPESSEFECVEGSVESNGVHYDYVKRKITNDTLYIMCLPNHKKAQLEKSQSKYSSEVNDFASNKKEKERASAKNNYSTEYHNIIFQYSFVAPAVVIFKASNGFFERLHTASVDAPEYPPQSVA